MNSVNDVSNVFTETTINFDQYLVIAVFLEVKPSTWSVDITNIIEEENQITVFFQGTESFLAVRTQPFHIVNIPISRKPIIFQSVS